MIRSNSRVWPELAKASESPGEFVRAVMDIRHETSTTVSKKIGTSGAYVNMITTNHAAIGVEAVYNLSKALNIDPYLLSRVYNDYKLKKYIEQQETNN